MHTSQMYAILVTPDFSARPSPKVFGGHDMIVQATIDTDGGVAVSIDSDGDQGDAYSTDVLDDMLTRAGIQAAKLWREARQGEKSDGPAE